MMPVTISMCQVSSYVLAVLLASAKHVTFTAESCNEQFFACKAVHAAACYELSSPSTSLFKKGLLLEAYQML